MVRGKRAERRSRVKAIIAKPKLLPKTEVKKIKVFRIGVYRSVLNILLFYRIVASF